MSALFCLLVCFISYPEKLDVYIPTFYKIRYILEELYAAVIWIISRLIIYIDQLNRAQVLKILFTHKISYFQWQTYKMQSWLKSHIIQKYILNLYFRFWKQCPEVVDHRISPLWISFWFLTKEFQPKARYWLTNCGK